MHITCGSFVICLLGTDYVRVKGSEQANKWTEGLLTRSRNNAPLIECFLYAMSCICVCSFVSGDNLRKHFTDGAKQARRRPGLARSSWTLGPLRPTTTGSRPGPSGRTETPGPSEPPGLGPEPPRPQPTSVAAAVQGTEPVTQPRPWGSGT